MKKNILFILFFCGISAYPQEVLKQDVVKMKQIDSLVLEINKSNLKIQYDSMIQDYPALGMNMKTYLTASLDGGELKKYVNKVNMVRQENGISKPLLTSSSFYFDQDKLIKVEEFIVEDGKEKHADWYYSEDKPLYYTFQSDMSAARANILLAMSKTFLKQFQNSPVKRVTTGRELSDTKNHMVKESCRRFADFTEISIIKSVVLSYVRNSSTS